MEENYREEKMRPLRTQLVILWKKGNLPYFSTLFITAVLPINVFFFFFFCETLVPLPGEFHGLRRLVGYSPWGHEESHTTEQLTRFLVSRTRIESGAMAVKALCPNHWTVRDLPSLSFS